ncbi:Hpt domain-containing protein [Planobispora rosea]|uniref:Hpt domain-containing protein n=1 Tax=Planobispora rosea TaxID=35762 RepID=UPI00083B23C5|nr:Hpt domain-containing protein [Planobispora rosea]
MTARGAAPDIRARIADLLVDGDEREIAFIERLVASFLERAPVMLADLDAAIAAGDCAVAAHRAHALKGAAANLGVSGVAGLCAETERLADAGRLGEALGHPGLLRSALAEAGDRFTEVLGDLRSGLPIVPRPA